MNNKIKITVKSTTVIKIALIWYGTKLMIDVFEHLAVPQVKKLTDDLEAAVNDSDL